MNVLHPRHLRGAVLVASSCALRPFFLACRVPCLTKVGR